MLSLFRPYKILRHGCQMSNILVSFIIYLVLCKTIKINTKLYTLIFRIPADYQPHTYNRLTKKKLKMELIHENQSLLSFPSYKTRRNHYSIIMPYIHLNQNRPILETKQGHQKICGGLLQIHLKTSVHLANNT